MNCFNLLVLFIPLIWFANTILTEKQLSISSVYTAAFEQEYPKEYILIKKLEPCQKKSQTYTLL